MRKASGLTGTTRPFESVNMTAVSKGVNTLPGSGPDAFFAPWGEM